MNTDRWLAIMHSFACVVCWGNVLCDAAARARSHARCARRKYLINDTVFGLTLLAIFHCSSAKPIYEEDINCDQRVRVNQLFSRPGCFLAARSILFRKFLRDVYRGYVALQNNCAKFASLQESTEIFWYCCTDSFLITFLCSICRYKERICARTENCWNK